MPAPVDLLVEDVNPMRLRVETEDGVLVVYDAALPPEVEQGVEPECSGFLAYYLSIQDETTYVFGGVLDAQADLGEALLALQHDLGVDLEALAHSDERVEAVLTEDSPARSPSEGQGRGEGRRGSRRDKARYVARGRVAWEPATLERVVEIMGFDPANLPEEDETSTGGVATPPPPPCASAPDPSQRCGSARGVYAEALELVIACGGEWPPPPPPPPPPCSGPCCGSSDPCCGNSDPCCGSSDPCCGSSDPCCGDSNPCCGSSNPCCPDCCGDLDCDGIPDSQDDDMDGDGESNGEDDDVDGDDIPDQNDDDIDGDGIPNGEDDDRDGDGIPNAGDGDDDGDDIPNADDPTPIGCTGGCCGSSDPCCGSSNPCCGSTDPCCGRNCDDGDSCTTDSCNSGVCEHEPMVCASDGKTCTDDVCLYGDCAHINHPDGSRCSDPLDPCAEGVCNAGICLLKACDGQCCDGVCCPAGTMCCASGLPCLPLEFQGCLDGHGGVVFACTCAPCLWGNDPREEANDAEQAWATATGEDDLCRRDAMQHCIGAALAAYDCGITCAICAGQVQELWQFDWDPMDYCNNEIGAFCSSPTSAEAVTCCEAQLHLGRLCLQGNCG